MQVLLKMWQTKIPCKEQFNRKKRWKKNIARITLKINLCIKSMTYFVLWMHPFCRKFLCKIVKDEPKASQRQEPRLYCLWKSNRGSVERHKSEKQMRRGKKKKKRQNNEQSCPETLGVTLMISTEDRSTDKSLVFEQCKMKPGRFVYSI